MSSPPNSILIVDDEAALRRTLKASLAANGFEVDEARDGQEALRSVRQRPFDLVLLDVNMPVLDGMEACRRIRDISPDAGIIMITVRDLDTDKIRALELGADDYVTKPFKLRELIARVRAVLRRTCAPGLMPCSSLQIGELKIDLEKRMVWRGTEEIHLSPKEFELMAYMMKHSGAPLTHLKLLRSVWGLEYGGELEYLRSYVRMLRKKIETDPNNPKYILTEPWIGYRFHNPTDPWSPSVEMDD